MAKPSSGPTYEFIGSEDLQRQIQLLQVYPEIFDEAFYPALDESAELVKKEMRPLLPRHRSGRLEQALGSKIFHSKTSALGTRAEIGFGKRYGMPSAPFAAALNQGSVAHEVVGGTRRSKDGMLHFSSGERFTAIGSVQIPALSGLHFAERGLEAARPAIDARINAAAEKVVQELAKP